MTKAVHIVGAGLVGPLMAIYLAKKGFEVRLHERRPDMRKKKISAGRSINLALTARGLQSLEEVGLRDAVMKIAIPMKGRMVHDLQGNCNLQPYGQKEHEVIYAASRGLLNMMLLDAAEAYKNVHIEFNRRCTLYSIDTGKLTFEDEKTGAQETVKADTVIAADGAWSAIRKAMLARIENFNYSQSFLEYGYKELVIPPDERGGFRIEKHALHIWPRHNYMMIALPNTEGSFTATLFYPYEGKDSFAQLKGPTELMEFFRRDFPDVVPHMPELERDFFGNPTGALVTVKCGPWHAGGKAVLIGDAAHAIVPFFAQGMNSGFEDCRVLNSLIESSSPDWEAVFAAFTKARKPNADAIADMAVENFVEMRDSVTDPKFILRKKVGFELEKRWPDRFIPRYSMVIFRPDIPYAEAQRRGALQDRILDRLCANISAPEQVNWSEAETLLKQMA
ncbi:MAG: FAD-dependent monooxygenase [Alphaproteobacteria bacterium]|nr:MAG: FAD-dependent monooxygenase [Alphaproteobacteria bacterium]